MINTSISHSASLCNFKVLHDNLETQTLMGMHINPTFKPPLNIKVVFWKTSFHPWLKASTYGSHINIVAS